MKHTRFILFSLAVFLSGKAAAQSSLAYVPVFHFHRQPLAFFLPEKPETGLSVASGLFAGFSAKPIVEGKPYEAFFCKLEVRTESYLGFGLRIHAGDYDADMRQFSVGK